MRPGSCDQRHVMTLAAWRRPHVSLFQRDRKEETRAARSWEVIYVLYRGKTPDATPIHGNTRSAEGDGSRRNSPLKIRGPANFTGAWSAQPVPIPARGRAEGVLSGVFFIRRVVSGSGPDKSPYCGPQDIGQHGAKLVLPTVRVARLQARSRNRSPRPSACGAPASVRSTCSSSLRSTRHSGPPAAMRTLACARGWPSCGLRWMGLPARPALQPPHWQRRAPRPALSRRHWPACLGRALGRARADPTSRVHRRWSPGSGSLRSSRWRRARGSRRRTSRTSSTRQAAGGASSPHSRALGSGSGRASPS